MILKPFWPVFCKFNVQNGIRLKIIANFVTDKTIKRINMPEICHFYGIVITMYLPDHNPPHFHVRYNE